ncbi:MAG: hypothetical protein ABIN58_13910 [candidate division WOR-3 bacterium]
MIVNMVVAVFLVIGLLIVLQYFNFIYLREIPLIGGWMMDLYERVFGVPKVLILHGGPADDSIGDWTALEKQLSSKFIFYSEDVDVSKFGAGIGDKLKQYGLVIVEDAKRLDKDKLMNLRDYVKGGGNLIWVGDAGTEGYVEYQNTVLARQTGWTRERVCINPLTYNPCNCKTVKKNSTTCRYLSDESEQEDIDMDQILGVSFVANEVGTMPELEIVDRGHWSVAGIKPKMTLTNVNKIASVSNSYSSALVANVNMRGNAYPGIIVNDPPGSSGSVVYFAYPPEETMEIVLPIVQRMRYLFYTLLIYTRIALK